MMSSKGLILSAITGTTGVLAQTMVPPDAGLFERLGTAGVLVFPTRSMPSRWVRQSA